MSFRTVLNLLFKKDVTAENAAAALHSYVFEVLRETKDDFEFHMRTRMGLGIDEQAILTWEWEVTYFVYSIVGIIADSFMATQRMGKTESVVNLYLNMFISLRLDFTVRQQQFLHKEMMLRYDAYKNVWNLDNEKPTNVIAALIYSLSSIAKNSKGSDDSGDPFFLPFIMKLMRSIVKNTTEILTKFRVV